MCLIKKKSKLAKESFTIKKRETQKSIEEDATAKKGEETDEKPDKGKNSKLLFHFGKCIFVSL